MPYFTIQACAGFIRHIIYGEIKLSALIGVHSGAPSDMLFSTSHIQEYTSLQRQLCTCLILVRAWNVSVRILALVPFYHRYAHIRTGKVLPPSAAVVCAAVPHRDSLYIESVYLAMDLSRSRVRHKPGKNPLIFLPVHATILV